MGCSIMIYAYYRVNVYLILTGRAVWLARSWPCWCWIWVECDGVGGCFCLLGMGGAEEGFGSYAQQQRRTLAAAVALPTVAGPDGQVAADAQGQHGPAAEPPAR